MALFTRVRHGFRALFHRTEVEQDLDAELREFRETAVEEKTRSGMSRDDAIRAARMELGSIEAVKDRVRDGYWESVLDTCWQDLRYAGRTLRKSRSFAVAAVLTLALGVGVNTTVFSVVNALIFRPLPVRDADRLVVIASQNTSNRTLRGVSFADLQIGVRMAVGATRQDIVRLVVQDGSRLVLFGLAAGLPVTLVCSRFVASFLFGVSARDPLILAGVAPILGCVALIACIIPAWRAARADPLVALRCE